MKVILESERDRRTLAWLIEQVGKEAVEHACDQLAGKHKPHPSNLAKILGLIPPANLSRPTPAQVQQHLNKLRRLMDQPATSQSLGIPTKRKTP